MADNSWILVCWRRSAFLFDRRRASDTRLARELDEGSDVVGFRVYGAGSQKYLLCDPAVTQADGLHSDLFALRLQIGWRDIAAPSQRMIVTDDEHLFVMRLLGWIFATTCLFTACGDDAGEAQQPVEAECGDVDEAECDDAQECAPLMTSVVSTAAAVRPRLTARTRFSVPPVRMCSPTAACPRGGSPATTATARPQSAQNSPRKTTARNPSRLGARRGGWPSDMHGRPGLRSGTGWREHRVPQWLLA